MDNKYYSKVYREVIEYLRHLNKQKPIGYVESYL